MSTHKEWRIEGLKIVGPTGEICTMTYDQARGGIGAHEIVPTQKLIAAAPDLLAACEAAGRSGPFCHDCSDTGASNGKPASQHATDCPACDGGRKYMLAIQINRMLRAAIAKARGQ